MVSTLFVMCLGHSNLQPAVNTCCQCDTWCIGTKGAPIIGSAIGNTLYSPIFNWCQITSRSNIIKTLLLIQVLGGQVVARKPYLIQTLRFTLKP